MPSSGVPRTSLAYCRAIGAVLLNGVDCTWDYNLCSSNCCGLCLGQWNLLEFWGKAICPPVREVLASVTCISVTGLGAGPQGLEARLSRAARPGTSLDSLGLVKCCGRQNPGKSTIPLLGRSLTYFDSCGLSLLGGSLMGLWGGSSCRAGD